MFKASSKKLFQKPTMGIDIGGSKILVGVVWPNNKVKILAKYPTRAGVREDYLIENIQNIIRQHLLPGISNIGIGIAGQVDFKRGVFLGGPNLPLHNVRAHDLLGATPKGRAVIDNNARCFTLAEATLGAAQKYERVFGITIGTGIGGGFVKDKKIVRGANNTMGEVGHVFINIEGHTPCSCGKYGHLEAYASGAAISRIYQMLTGCMTSAIEIEESFKTGDKEIYKIVDKAATALATGLVNILTVVDPDCIVIGGGLVKFHGLWQLTKTKVGGLVPFPHLKKTPILTSKLGDVASVLGAALLTIQN